jgi:hypothetical protein
MGSAGQTFMGLYDHGSAPRVGVGGPLTGGTGGGASPGLGGMYGIGTTVFGSNP